MTQQTDLEGLVQRQMGRMIDIDIGRSALRHLLADKKDIERLHESFMPKEEREASYKDLTETVLQTARSQRGIYTDIMVEDIVANGVNTYGIATSVPFRKFLQFLVNPEGTLPIYNALSDSYFNATQNDFAEGAAIAERFGVDDPSLGKRIENYRRNLKHVNEIIERYKNGQKPTVDDMFKGRSVSECYLQSGTTEEGLSREFFNVVNANITPLSREISNPLQNCSINEELDYTWKEIPKAPLYVINDNLDLVREGRNIAARYLQFVSDLSLEVEATNPGAIKTLRNNDKIDDISGLYLDREWQRRDEAIGIAQSLANVLQKRIDYLEGLRRKSK